MNDLDGFEVLAENLAPGRRRPGVPSHARRRLRDVLAPHGPEQLEDAPTTILIRLIMLILIVILLLLPIVIVPVMYTVYVLFPH